MSDLFDQEVVDELKDIMGEDIGLLIETFDADCQLKVAELEQLVISEDADGIRRTAHSLKGSSNNLGAIALAQLCAQMEHLARENRLEDLPLLLSAVKDSLSKTLAELPKVF